MTNPTLKEFCRELLFIEKVRVGLSYFALPKSQKLELVFPEKIDGFKLTEILFSGRKNNKFNFARYEDAEGKSYFAKQINVSDFGLENYWLRNEIEVYRFLKNVYKKHGKDIIAKFPNIRIPDFKGLIEDKQRLLLMTEWVNGNNIQNMPIKEKLSILSEVIDYFRYISDKIKKNDDFKIAKRSMVHMMLLFWPVFIRSAFRCPDQLPFLIRAAAKFVKDWPFLLKQKEKTLNHRDLGYKNILIRPDGLSYIIDFELTTWIHPMSDVVQMAISCWKRADFAEEFIKSDIMKKISSDSKQYRIYRSLSLYAAVHSISTTADELLYVSKNYLGYVLNINLNGSGKIRRTLANAKSKLLDLIRTIRAPIFRIIKSSRFEPISDKYGYDRGTPIDRIYIESFLDENKGCIRGVCLEIHDDAYTKKFGGSNVSKGDVLDIDIKNSLANIHGDFRNLKEVIADNTYDCLILNHTLNLIDDIEAAIGECHRILKPGGVLLVTLPGPIAPVNDQLLSHWRLTHNSARYLFAKCFNKNNLNIKTYGNLIAGQAFLAGLAAEELTKEQITHHDPRFPITIAVKAVK